MKSVVLCLVCFFLAVTCAYAETMYVTDFMQVMVRTGPDRTYKIIAMPRSGTPVEVLEAQDEWSMVRLPGEKEGWMLSRYLSSSTPSKDVIAQLRSQNRSLTLRTKTLAEENARLKNERKDLEKTLSTQTLTARTITKSYETLKNESKDFLALKASYEKAAQELAAKSKQVAGLQGEVEGLRKTQALRWFLAGAIVIFVGFVLGYASRRPKRRSSLM